MKKFQNLKIQSKIYKMNFTKFGKLSRTRDPWTDRLIRLGLSFFHFHTINFRTGIGTIEIGKSRTDPDRAFRVIFKSVT